MKRILLILFVFCFVQSYGQSVTGTKTRFPGIWWSSKDTSNVTSADSIVVLANRGDQSLYWRWSNSGPWSKITTQIGIGYINNQIGSNLSTQSAKFRISDTAWARMFRGDKFYGDSIQATGSGGGNILSNSGSLVAQWGAGGGTNFDFHGFAGYNSNRSSSYTIRSFTDKGYVDSIAALTPGTVTSIATNNGTGINGGTITTTGTLAIDTTNISTRLWRQKGVDSLNGLINLRVKYTDTSAMLTPYLRKSDTATMFSNVVRTYGDQNIGGIKTFSSTIAGNSNLFINGAASIGYLSTSFTYKLDVNGNARFSGSVNVNGATEESNVAMVVKAASGTGTYLMFGRNSADVLTYSLKNDGSANFNGLVTASGGISSTTGSFSSAVTAGSFVKTGGTSSQFLKADGSVDGTSYATAASLSGYLPLSGGTLTGALSGTSATFSGLIQTTVTSVTNPSLQLNYNSTSTYAKHSMNGNGDYVISAPATNGVTSGALMLQAGGSDALRIVPTTLATTLYGALSGTSASFTANSTTVALNTSTRAIDITGKNNFYAVSITGGATTGQSFGQVISAGTNSSDISFAVYNKAETTPYLFVRGDGNVGIGTTSPNAALTVVANDLSNPNVALRLSSTSYTGVTYPNTRMVFGTNYSTYPTWNLGSIDGAYTGASWGGSLIFSTNNDATTGNLTERMRLTSGGALLLNTTTDDGSNKLQVNGGIAASRIGAGGSALSGSVPLSAQTGANTLFYINQYDANSIELNAVRQDNGATKILRIQQVGGGTQIGGTLDVTGAATFASTVTATAFYESSDLRQKTVHTTAKSSDGIDAIQYTFNPNKTEKWGYGAQQVQKVLPYAVSTGSDGFLKVDYTTVHTYKIAQLEKRIAELEKLLQK